MQNQQKTVDFFSLRVYLRIKIWIQNQISKIINHKEFQDHGQDVDAKQLELYLPNNRSGDRKTGIYDGAKRRTDPTNEEVER